MSKKVKHNSKKVPHLPSSNEERRDGTDSIQRQSSPENFSNFEEVAPATHLEDDQPASSSLEPNVDTDPDEDDPPLTQAYIPFSEEKDKQSIESETQPVSSYWDDNIVPDKVVISEDHGSLHMEPEVSFQEHDLENHEHTLSDQDISLFEEQRKEYGTFDAKNEKISLISSKFNLFNFFKRKYEQLNKNTQSSSSKRKKKTWKQSRKERRRRRIWFEELIAWVFVPLILAFSYWCFVEALGLFGKSPSELWEGLQDVYSSLKKK